MAFNSEFQPASDPQKMTDLTDEISHGNTQEKTSNKSKPFFLSD